MISPSESQIPMQSEWRKLFKVEVEKVENLNMNTNEVFLSLRQESKSKSDDNSLIS